MDTNVISLFIVLKFLYCTNVLLYSCERLYSVHCTHLCMYHSSITNTTCDIWNAFQFTKVYKNKCWHLTKNLHSTILCLFKPQFHFKAKFWILESQFHFKGKFWILESQFYFKGKFWILESQFHFKGKFWILECYVNVVLTERYE